MISMMNAVKEKIRNSAAYAHLGRYIYTLRNRSFDRRHNVETAREVTLEELSIDSPNRQYGVMYAGTDPKSFKKLFDNFEIDHEKFVFVDLGSGKGRVLLMAAEYPFQKITGVEFAAELNAIAQKNIRNYRNKKQKCMNLESVRADAAEFVPPAQPTIYYIFNPFLAEVLSKVVNNIEQSLADNPREIYFIYAYPTQKHIFEQSPVFNEIYSDEWYSIFKN